MVSLKDIAAACGVSIATVSKALNNHNDISIETKEYIRKVAGELGYYPNSAAKALKTNRTYNIGVLFVDEAQSGLTHDFFAYILNSFKEEVESKGYDITFINNNRTRSNRMSYLAHSRYRGFDGVCIACVDFYDPEVVELVRSDIPVVTIDYVFNNCTAIMSDNIRGMRDLLTYVYNKGHRRIAYIHGLRSSVTDSRLLSFNNTAMELGLDIPDNYIKEAPYRSTKETEEKTYERRPVFCTRMIFPHMAVSMQSGIGDFPFRMTFPSAATTDCASRVISSPSSLHSARIPIKWERKQRMS